MRRRILPSRDDPGGCVLRLTSSERALLAELPRQIEELLAGVSGGGFDGPESGFGHDEATDASPRAGEASAFPAIDGVPAVPAALRRLFPPAYTRDDEAERNYVRVARADLLEHHRRALQTLSATASARRLAAEELQGWMTALNDVRLVLGTVLDVQEDDEPSGQPVSQQMLYYYYLSGLQVELVDFLSGGLPPPSLGADDLIPGDPWGEPLGGLRWDGTPQPGGGA